MESIKDLQEEHVFLVSYLFNIEVPRTTSFNRTNYQYGTFIMMCWCIMHTFFSMFNERHWGDVEENPWFADAFLRLGKQWQNQGMLGPALATFRLAMPYARFQARVKWLFVLTLHIQILQVATNRFTTQMHSDAPVSCRFPDFSSVSTAKFRLVSCNFCGHSFMAK